MRHGISGRKLGRTSSHRQALFANLATSLIKHGQIQTTLPKAKELRRIVDPLITLGKNGDLSARRKAAQTITEADVVKYLFSDVAPAMKNRQGGYTRVLRSGFRKGDNAEMAIIQLSDKPKNTFADVMGEVTVDDKTITHADTSEDKGKVKKEAVSKEVSPKADKKTVSAKEKTEKKASASKTSAPKKVTETAKTKTTKKSSE